MTKTSSAAAVTTATPEIETDPGSFQLIPIAKLVESPSNHRRKSWGDLDELAASIKSKGVLVPICVRPAPAGLVEGAFEIVYGHRRFRAATKAGLAEMPALVRHLSDVEVVEAQVIENLQRTDVHPLEEAEGYEQLLASKDRTYTVDDIAARVGKSKGYVYARMKLLDLTKEGREAFYEGKLTPSTALYLARVSPELQPKALEALTPEWRDEDEGPMPAREASEILQNEFMCRLKDAPFKLADADLLPSAGPCTTCPRRSGAQPDLFDASEGIGADVCTDPKCFAVKKAAAWTRLAAEAEAEGRKVLSPKETKGVFSQYGGLNYNTDFVAISDCCHSDPKNRTYKALLGKRAAAAIVLAKDSKGAVHELLPKTEIPKLLRDAGHAFKVDPPVTSETTKADRERLEAEAQFRRAIEQRRRAVVLSALAKREPDDELWRLVVRANEDAAYEALDDVGHTKAIDLSKELAARKGKELRAFALGLALDGILERHPYGDREKAQKALYAWAKVDEKAIRAEVKAAQKEAAAAPAKGKKKGAPPELKWVSADDEHTAEPIDGLVYHVAPTPGGKTWVAKVSTTHGDSWKTLGTFTTLLSDAKKLCAEDLLERGADAILANAGDGKLNAKGLKGAAVAKKKVGRRA